MVGCGSMRLPDYVEILYLDFDGFFASVAQQADPRLRGQAGGDCAGLLLRRRRA